MSNSAPAGWYPDPNDPRVEHWWDGSAYRDRRWAAAPHPSALAPQQAPHPQAGVPAQVVYVTAGPARVPGSSPKSRTVAAILGFFLGYLGIDRFYLGNIGMGVAKLLLGWATFGIWPLIDWIVILVGAAHDGDGLPVVNWS